MIRIRPLPAPQYLFERSTSIASPGSRGWFAAPAGDLESRFPRQIFGAGHLVGTRTPADPRVHRARSAPESSCRPEPAAAPRRCRRSIATAPRTSAPRTAPAPALADRARTQVAGGLRQFETMRVRERQHDVIFGRGRLQLEIEGAAEALCAATTPGPIHPAAVRGMNHQLHAAGFIEETLEDDRVEASAILAALRGRARYSISLSGRDLIDPHRLDQPSRRSRVRRGRMRRPAASPSRRSRFQSEGERPPPTAHRNVPRLAQPERNRRRLTVGVFTRTCRAPRAISDTRCCPIEYVALQALDGKVFVDRTDRETLGSSTTL